MKKSFWCFEINKISDKNFKCLKIASLESYSKRNFTIIKSSLVYQNKIRFMKDNLILLFSVK